MARRPARTVKKGEQDAWELWNVRLRGLGLWLLGAYGVWNELLLRDEIRLPALGVYGFFLGLPIANVIDSVISERKNGKQ